MNKRMVLITLDGVGVGALPDARDYGDADADTLLHVAQRCGGLNLPNLGKMGLGNIAEIPGVPPVPRPAAVVGRLKELSAGKDSTTGHWELAGLVQTEPLPTFPRGFPPQVIEAFRRETGLDPLGNTVASGTEILLRLGEEHLRTGRPIVYTSVDSVFQIAAHEDIIPVERLYEICRIARRILDPCRIGRVIARPFTGSCAADFERTPRRHDFSLPPAEPTVLDALVDAGFTVRGVGKIHDIFAGRGITETVYTESNADGMEKTLLALEEVERGLIFTNLIDFDMLYGHRLDSHGFGRALEAFDAWLPRLCENLLPSDLLVITADHGCDPTTDGTDHTREYVPLILWYPGMSEGEVLRGGETMAMVAATVAAFFGISYGNRRSLWPREAEISSVKEGLALL